MRSWEAQGVSRKARLESQIRGARRTQPLAGTLMEKKQFSSSGIALGILQVSVRLGRAVNNIFFSLDIKSSPVRVIRHTKLVNSVL